MKSKKLREKNQTPRQLNTNSGLRAVVLGLCLLVLASGGTWAFMEFVVWNRLPTELVGKWEVVQGPPEYREAVFDFHRNGTMVGQVNQGGTLGLINARIRVEGNKIYSTTRHPRTGQEHTRVQVIRTLNLTELVVEDEQGKVLKMARIP